ncbi:RNA polymerase II transcriptional coactivator [Zootermopsis nevadensis]|uniref:Putative RNA polymerase II transcriptional coactivator n=1 Tax=Zootermopsis nevadensis TaxID=136037 RepID=A0A067QUX2_ZOONE|nr:RNA polymerase II transcriptional coactivator [Zootermopsis nevadensis]KDR13791.1 Putative RNA polymerase II transcriptional coactivator [Zootermopsis nevadensis]
MGKDKDRKKKKNKKEEVVESDSTSDSGPEDVNPPPSKKTKPNTSSSKKDDEEPSWFLDKNRFIKVREYRGKVYVDIREYYEADGDLKPGKKGISLSTTQWQKLKSLISEVDDAVKEKC